MTSSIAKPAASKERPISCGHVGARKNRHLPAHPNGDPLSAIDLRNVLAQAILDVQTKKLPPRRAGAIAQLRDTYCRLIPIGETRRACGEAGTVHRRAPTVRP